MEETRARPATTSAKSGAIQVVEEPEPTPPPGMIFFRGATFTMGALGVGFDVATPAHDVTVPSFFLDITEVTVAAYGRCVDVGACTKPQEPKYQKGAVIWACNWTREGFDNDPINCVSWEQATVYCRWSGKELPTEEMWEYAARGQEGREFPWGMGDGEQPWSIPENIKEYVGTPCRGPGRQGAETCPIGSFPKGDTPDGIKDMASNVTEWAANVYCPYDRPQCEDSERVQRGGAAASSGRFFRAENRWGLPPDLQYTTLGFRCAKRVDH